MKAIGLSLVLSLALMVAGAVDASTLRLCAQGSPKRFDPANTDSGFDHTATIPICDGRVETERGGSALIPALATGWTVSACGRVTAPSASSSKPVPSRS